MDMEFATRYYDLESGAHRTQLWEDSLDLSRSHWAVRASLRLGLVVVPVLLVAALITLLKLIA